MSSQESKYTHEQEYNWYMLAVSKVKDLPHYQQHYHPYIDFDCYCVRHEKTEHPGDDDYSGWRLFLDFESPPSIKGFVSFQISTFCGWEEKLPPGEHMSQIRESLAEFQRMLYTALGQNIEWNFEQGINDDKS